MSQSHYALTNRCFVPVMHPSLMLFGRNLFWNDKCDHAFVEGLVVRVNQVDSQFVRIGEKTLQDDWVTTRIGPHP